MNISALCPRAVLSKTKIYKRKKDSQQQATNKTKKKKKFVCLRTALGHRVETFIQFISTVLQKHFPVVHRAFVVCYGKAVWSSSLFSFLLKDRNTYYLEILSETSHYWYKCFKPTFNLCFSGKSKKKNMEKRKWRKKQNTCHLYILSFLSAILTVMLLGH
jgi:nitrate reductase NapE component